MPFLILDVPHNGRNVRLAYPEAAVPLLPSEAPDFAGHPPRRIRFYVPNCIGNHERWWKLQQQVNVVFHPTDGMDKNILVLANAGGVSP
jgi:hypothetical protein